MRIDVNYGEPVEAAGQSDIRAADVGPLPQFTLCGLSFAVIRPAFDGGPTAAVADYARDRAVSEMKERWGIGPENSNFSRTNPLQNRSILHTVTHTNPVSPLAPPARGRLRFGYRVKLWPWLRPPLSPWAVGHAA